MAAIAPKKVDLAVDNVGGVLFNEVVAMLGLDGRISVVGRSGGVVPGVQHRDALLPEESHWRGLGRGLHHGGSTSQRGSRSSVV